MWCEKVGFFNEHYWCYFSNTVLGDLHRSRRNATSFMSSRKSEKNSERFDTLNDLWQVILTNLSKPSWSYRFWFSTGIFQGEKNLLIRNEITFCERKDTTFKTFIEKNIQIYYNNKMVNKESQQFFSLKEQKLHISCKIYKDECSLGEVWDAHKFFYFFLVIFV